MFRRGLPREQVTKEMNVSSIYVNIVIVLRGYTCLKTISNINNTFPRSQIKGQSYRLTG